MSQAQTQSRARRAGVGKSRNGCLTCKIRRVKCDETKPHCRRCTESGRKCEGPVSNRIMFVEGQSISSSRSTTPQLELSPFAPQHSESERRAFHFYLNRAAPVFAGAIDGVFWEDLVPRLASTYDFVWDVSVCLSIFIEHVPYIPIPDEHESHYVISALSREHRRALRLYSRAIASVRKLMNSGQVDESLIVLSYILFSSVEFQQQHVRTGLELLKTCCSILTQDLTRPYRQLTSSLALDVHQVVGPFILKKGLYTTILGQGSPTTDEQLVPVAKTPTTLTLEDARQGLSQLKNQCYELVRVAEIVAVVDDEHPFKLNFILQRVAVLARLREWKSAFHASLGNSPVPGTRDGRLHSYLCMYWSLCYISLGACGSPLQIAFDEYMGDFVELTEQAAVYLKCTIQSTDSEQEDIFSPGVVPALYFCALKCRHPTTRRRALRLLRHAPAEHNDWGLIAPDLVVAKAISVEEGGHLSDAASLESDEIVLPPEQRRFAHVSVVGQLAPGCQQRRALELSRFEIQRDGSRRLFNEHVWLDDEKHIWPDDEYERLGIPMGL
ncbi:hypothetical protein B0A52_07739 [Exophiala mesophila]|uniref:Zn(2)-C6 fungal-type domain-containing protein n=1 Tax=Exophiala mesophila TaxID=212818 RepID=A0A438MXY2_EXOME|nr:hypothetical protein B0A52_07739 [Exophiala mesophila]